MIYLILFYLMHMLAICIACWIVHETGHYMAWRVMGIRPLRLAYPSRKHGAGLGIVYECKDLNDIPLSHQIYGAIAGPITSILFGIAVIQDHYILGKCSILLGLFLLLLPCKGGDGYKAAQITKRLLKGVR